MPAQPGSSRRPGQRAALLTAILFLPVVLVAPGCLGGDSRAERHSLMVFAAASLQDVLRELGDHFANERAADERQADENRIEILYNFAGSNFLAQQIEAARSADLFLSADEQWMDHVDRRGLVVEETRSSLVSNRLVIILNARSKLSVTQTTDLADAPYRHLSLADPEAVPAGRYAKAYLQSIPHGEGSLWDLVAQRVAPSPDVRAAVALVESDPEIVGIVYRTEAVRSTQVKVAVDIPPSPGLEIRYAAAVMRDSKIPVLAGEFLAFLEGEKAAKIWDRYGFVPLPKRGSKPSQR